MLTEEEIGTKMQGFECPAYLRETCYKPIYEQAVLAIRLQKRLDKIRKTLEQED